MDKKVNRSARMAIGTCILLLACALAVDAQPNPVITPDTIAWPATVLAGKSRSDVVVLSNTGDQTLHIYQIEVVPDSANPPIAPWITTEDFGWRDLSAGDSMYIWVRTFGDPQLAGIETCRQGRIRIVSSAPSPKDTIYCYICMLVRPSSTLTSGLDTLSTACTDLVVSSTGNFGNGGVGTINMDFFGPADCDTGLNSRGNSKVYLFDGSPIILRRPFPDSIAATWSMYGDHRFVRAPGGKPESTFSTFTYNAYTTGTLLTTDSLVKVEITWYASKHPDTCNFVIQKMILTATVTGTSVGNLQIGQLADFDIPTDSGSANDVAGTDLTRRMVYQRGFNSSDGESDCTNNAIRYGGVGLLFFHMKNKARYDSLYGGSNFSTDMCVDPTGGLRPDSMWRIMKIAGYNNEPRITDQMSMLTYKSGVNGFTLPANDTLFLYSAIASVNTAASVSAGLDSLKRAMDKAKIFQYTSIWECCEGQRRGNINLSGIVDLTDLSCLVSYLTGGGYRLPCYGSANVDGTGIVDLADLSALVSYLTGGGFVLPNCP